MGMEIPLDAIERHGWAQRNHSTALRIRHVRRRAALAVTLHLPLRLGSCTPASRRLFCLKVHNHCGTEGSRIVETSGGVRRRRSAAQYSSDVSIARERK